MRLQVVFLVLILLLACPNQVMAADFNWTLTWQNGQTLTEIITTDDPDLVNPEGGWQQGEQPGTYVRQTEGWAKYNRLSDRLPIAAQTKNYLAIKITKMKLDSENYNDGSTFYELTQAGQGQVKMEVPGFIMQARPAVKSQWSEGFSATWTTAPQEQTEVYDFAMTAITIEILPAVISLLVIGWGLIWIIYRRQVKRMERLIEARYSLDNVVTAEITTIEQTEEIKNADEEETKNI